MTLEFLQAFILGVSLAAACGFRVFVPPFIVSVAALGLYCWNRLSPPVETGALKT